MPRKFEIKQSPRPRDVTADRRTHEAREQWHPADAEKGVLWIDPRAHRRLEDLHDCADDMEEQDNLRLLQCFQSEKQHRDLDAKGRKEQEIIARERGAPRIPVMCRNQQTDHRAAEEASPSLFHEEAKKFVDEGSRGPLTGPMTELRLRHDEGGERGPNGRGAAT